MNSKILFSKLPVRLSVVLLCLVAVCVTSCGDDEKETVDVSIHQQWMMGSKLSKVFEGTIEATRFNGLTFDLRYTNTYIMYMRTIKDGKWYTYHQGSYTITELTDSTGVLNTSGEGNIEYTLNKSTDNIAKQPTLKLTLNGRKAVFRPTFGISNEGPIPQW
ncbi:MAG: hypothetical protein J6I60_04370 [Bacteroidaceae bacterium]|nr:hypothetical protein [Bacteroidaceae bacterium]